MNLCQSCFPNIPKGQLLHLYLKGHCLLLPGKVLPSILYRGMTYKVTVWPINNQKRFQQSHLHPSPRCLKHFSCSFLPKYMLLSLLIAWSHEWNKNIWIKKIHLAKIQNDCFATFLKKTYVLIPQGPGLQSSGIAWNGEDWSIYEPSKLQPCVRVWDMLLIIHS